MTVSRHNADQDNTLLTTPTALMLDTRLTPLERNGWQVLRMLRASDGTSSLASLGQLRRYLTSIPLGQKAGYETAWRVLVVLRLTGWISLVGQQRDPLTSNVLSERYQVHEHPHAFAQACEIDPDLPQLLHESAGHENNQVSRVATYIQATLAQAPADSDIEDDNDDAPPPASTIEPKTLAEETSPDMKSVSPPRVMQQNSPPARKHRILRLRIVCVSIKNIRTVQAKTKNPPACHCHLALRASSPGSSRTFKPPCIGCPSSSARMSSMSCRPAARAAACTTSSPTSLG